MRHYATPLLKSFDEIQTSGRDFGAAHPNFVEGEIDKGSPDDLALLNYTSGTTGNPKGVMLSHANLLSAADALLAAEHFSASDEILCYLPMAWIGDSLLSLVLALLVGFTANCPERPETVQRDLRELGPTVVIAPPRIWENLLTSLRLRAADASPLKRKLFAFFQRRAKRTEQFQSENKNPSLTMRLGSALGEYLVYGPVRDQLGFRRARLVYTGGAPLGPDTFRFFRSFGLNLKQVWGSTELSGLATLQPDGEASPDTVGPVLAGTEVRISEAGEVLIRSPAVFQGYYKQPEATQDALTADGWYRTGDSGYVDPRGHLAIVDRAKDVGKLEDGTTFAPQFVENKLKFSPFIGEVIVFGHQRPFVSAIVALDLGTVGNWAERRNLAYTSFQDLSGKSEVRELIRDEIREINASLPVASQVGRFALLNKEFDPDDNEITRTRKIRRRFVAEKYAAVVEALYSGAPQVDLATEITYEDGRKATLNSTIAIDDIEQTRQPVPEPVYA
jgi:long-chain acyl-CoA synthetase